jgi:hypothetical protein
MDGPNPNPNVANTGGGQIKSNQIKWSPREKKSNQIQIKYRPRKPKWDQMAAREGPAIWRFNRFFKPHKNRRAGKSIIVDIAIPNP